MTCPPTTEGRLRTHGSAIAKALASAAGLALLTHASWNLFAPDLFGLPEMRLKQALGPVGFGFAVTLLPGQTWPGARHG